MIVSKRTLNSIPAGSNPAGMSEAPASDLRHYLGGEQFQLVEVSEIEHLEVDR